MSENISRQTRMRRMTVREADQISTIGPNLVKPTATLEEIVTSCTQTSRALTLCVVDEAGRLLGLLPFNQIVDEIFLQVSPEIFLNDIHNLADAEEFALKSRLSNAATAQEMMRPPIFVRESETVVEAFNKMQSNRLSGLPIVDTGMVVIGYLDAIELLAVWQQAAYNYKPTVAKNKGEEELG